MNEASKTQVDLTHALTASSQLVSLTYKLVSSLDLGRMSFFLQNGCNLLDLHENIDELPHSSERSTEPQR